MKIFLVSLLAAFWVFAFSGCNRSYAESVAPKSQAVAASHYKVGYGLQLSPAASHFIGLASTAVASRDVGQARTVTAVPTDALLRTVKGDFVFVANGGWLLRTPVQIGTSDGTWFEIKDGLYEGDTIVTQGTRALWLAELQAVNGGVGCADGH